LGKAKAKIKATNRDTQDAKDKSKEKAFNTESQKNKE